jgi:U6 snRNA-associated Sm-like protein LSm1
MERLSLNESPAPAPRTPQQNQQFSQNALGPAGPQPTGGPPQLPPQMFTTAAQLLDLTDSMSTQTRSKRPIAEREGGREEYV